ncbi:MAG: hypothetical protein ACTSVF_05845 [Candidatus Asgardarchaeia archaeon]
MEELRSLLDKAMGILDKQFRVTLKSINEDHALVKCEREIYDKIRCYLTLISGQRGRYMQISSSGCMSRLFPKRSRS